MRFYYLDTGLQNHLGHHANSCRTITTEVRRRGIEMIVVAAETVIPELQAELNAIPHFRFYTYNMAIEGRISGWMSAFFLGVRWTTEDLAKLPEPNADDVVYMNTAQPVQLMAVMSWLNLLPAERRPRVVVEFGTHSGLDVNQVGDNFTFEVTDPRVDARGTLYDYVRYSATDHVLKHVVPMTFDPVASQGYSFITGMDTGVLPLPQRAYAPPRRKSGKRPITVSVLGHQRLEKGYGKVPVIFETLLQRHSDIFCLAHNPAPQGMPETQKMIHQLARARRVIVDERPADETHWHYLFAGTDIVLCPYDPSKYGTAYSAIAAEALANGLPMVVPAKTSLSRFVTAHGGAATTFDTYGAQAIAEATSKAITAYDDLAETAFIAAKSWNQDDRKAMLVDCILGR